MDLAGLYSILLSSLVLGSLYALMSSGLSLIWGTVRLFNFAHGSLVMLGAYLAWTVSDSRGLGLGPWVGLIVAVLAMFLIGIFMERIIARPFLKRENSVIIVLMTTLAASSFIDNMAQLIWGPRMKRLSPLVDGKMEIFGTSISNNEILITILAPLLLIGLWVLLKTTRVGIAIRAVEQNQRFAQLVGINVQWTYAITFGLGTCMAAFAGSFLGSKAFIVPTMGGEPMLKAFIVVILGGLGSLGGTIAGAYLVGFVEAASIYFFGLYWTPAILFLMMIIVLVFRPTGLFGENS
jgi:branched-chain amino acid transport system permease protein